ncbi:MAG TPA: hypothetical protein VKW09_14970 [bacterium]|nr:hypothetical protein [bacterium]
MSVVDRLNRWFQRRFDIREIGDGGYILKLGLVRHRGPRYVFRDGTVVNPGDLVGELHMANDRTARLHGEGKPGLRFRREVFRLMAPLARDLRERPEYRDIRALCGASLFWAEAERAGFEHRPLPAFTRWWLTWWERFLLAKYHPEGRGRLAEGRRTELRQAWLTRTTLEQLVARGASRRVRDNDVT